MNLAGQIKATYAAAAQTVGRRLVNVGWLPAAPPDRAERWRHWAVSLTRAHDSLGIAALDVPWWTYDSIDAVEAFIAGRDGDVRAFEWGSGASTIWLARRVRSIDSVEHHRGFAATISAALAQGSWTANHVSLEVVEAKPTVTPVTPSAKSGYAGQDFSAYVDQIDVVGGEFDLIVIDGRARQTCLLAAMPHLAADGMIVFDNSWRWRYRDAIVESGLEELTYRGLTPTLPYPDQTSLLRRPVSGS